MFDITKNLKVIIEAVRFLGMEVNFSGRNDILAEGRKFSGNAFYNDGDNCYHHGTLLVSSDIRKLSRYLLVSKEKIKSKGIKSVETRVTNLSSVNTEITIDCLSKSLEKSFEIIFSNKVSERMIVDESFRGIEKLYNKYSSWEWRYGETPNFEINFYKRFKWGDFDLNLNLKDGMVSEIIVFSDSLDTKLIKNIEDALRGLKFTREDILIKLNDLKM